MAKKKVKKGGRAVEKPQAAEGIASADYVDWRRHAEGEEIARRQRQNEIIQRFVDANAAESAPPIPTPEKVWDEVRERMNADAAGRRWTLPVLLAVAVVGGGLLGAAAKDRELRPTIHLLNRAVDATVLESLQYQRTVSDQNAELEHVRNVNARLMLEHGGAIQAMDQARDTDRAAAHDLRRADRALQYDQSVDRISDRAKTWEALRAVERAERRLNETP